ncbi:hypothetical protein AE937_07695 [Bacteroides fragilis]|nr:hypothetical protein [Bacteroides fragilis]
MFSKPLLLKYPLKQQVEDGRWGWKINGIKTASSTNLYISQSTACTLKGGRWKIETCFLYEKKAEYERAVRA